MPYQGAEPSPRPHPTPPYPTQPSTDLGILLPTLTALPGAGDQQGTQGSGTQDPGHVSLGTKGD